MKLLSLPEHEINVKSTMETSNLLGFLNVTMKLKTVMKINYVPLFEVIAVTII
jgi:hypothetical protein